MHFLPFETIKSLMLQMDHAKLLDVLTSLPISHSILPRAVCFATSSQANHAICSFIDSSGYASGPIKRCLFRDYIIKYFKVRQQHKVNTKQFINLNALEEFHVILGCSLENIKQIITIGITVFVFVAKSLL